MVYILFLLFFTFTFNKSYNNQSIHYLKNILIFLTCSIISAEIMSVFGLFDIFYIRITVISTLIIYFIQYFQKTPLTQLSCYIQLLKKPKSFQLFSIFSLLILAAFFYFPTNWDSNTYHLPRIIHWLQNGNLNHYTSSIYRQIYQPYLNEIFLSYIYSTFGPISLLNAWQVLFLFFSYLTLVQINKNLPYRFQLKEENILLPILLCWSLLLQSFTTKNDIVLLFFLLYLILKLITFHKKPEIYLITIILVLGFLTKGTFNIYVIIIFALFIALTFRYQTYKNIHHLLNNKKQLKITILSLLTAFILIAPTIYRNISLAGNIFGQDKIELSYYQNNQKSISVGLSNTIKILGYQSFTPFGNPINSNSIVYLNNFFKLPNINDSNSNWMGGKYEIPDPKKIKGYLSSDMVPNLLVVYLSFIVFLIIIFKIIFGKKIPNINIFILLSCMSLFGLFIFSYLLKWQPWHTRLLFPILLCQSFAIVHFFEKTKFITPLRNLSFTITLFIVIFNTEQPIIASSRISRSYPNFWNIEFWNRKLENKIPKYIQDKFQYFVIMDKISSHKKIGVLCEGDDKVFGYMFNYRTTNNKFYYYGEINNPTKKLFYKNPQFNKMDFIIVKGRNNINNQFYNYQIVVDTTKNSRWLLLQRIK